MLATVWLPPVLKALVTALLVAAASVAAEALGPFWGAWVASLPVSAGPAYVFLGMAHGADFVTASALSSGAANAATGLFLVAYGLLARVIGAAWSLGAAVLVWLAASLATQQIGWTPGTALLLNLAVYGAGLALLRPTRSAPSAPTAQRRPWWTIPARAGAVASFVSLVIAVSTAFGPAATGVAAVFPISLISLFVIMQAKGGRAAAPLLAAHALWPMLGFGIMLLVLHIAIPRLGVIPALWVTLLASAGWSAALALRAYSAGSAAGSGSVFGSGSVWGSKRKPNRARPHST